MRALWVEDHQLIGDSLEVLLQVLMPELSLDKARTVDAAVQWAQAIHYELVLMDWWMGDQDGLTTLTALRHIGCQAPVIVVSGDDRHDLSSMPEHLHVVGYVSKAADPQQLVQTIKQALAALPSGTSLPSVKGPEGGQALTGLSAPSILPQAELHALFPELTDRQAEVFVQLMRGLSDKEIARQLVISGNTARTHVKAILQVVGANKRGEAVYIARQRGARV